MCRALNLFACASLLSGFVFARVQYVLCVTLMDLSLPNTGAFFLLTKQKNELV